LVCWRWTHCLAEASPTAAIPVHHTYTHTHTHTLSLSCSMGHLFVFSPQNMSQVLPAAARRRICCRPSQRCNRPRRLSHSSIALTSMHFILLAIHPLPAVFHHWSTERKIQRVTPLIDAALTAAHAPRSSTPLTPAWHQADDGTFLPECMFCRLTYPWLTYAGSSVLASTEHY